MKLIALFLAISFHVAAQQPVLTSVNSGPVSKSAMVQQITDHTQQIKEKSETIKIASAQLKTTRDQLAKAKADLVKKRNELKGIKDDERTKTSLENQIRNLGILIASLERKIIELEELINQQTASIAALQDAIDKLQVKIDEQNRQEEQKNKKKKEAASLYVKVKMLVDSLPPAEKATLTSTDLGTLNFYRDMYRTDATFKLRFQEQEADARKELNAEQAKNFTEEAKDRKKATLEMIRKYLAMLSAMQPQL